MIWITSHALRRMEERKIGKDHVEEVIRNPEETINVKHGRRASYRRYGHKFIVVIFEESEEGIKVITVLRVDERRLKRYGFSRV
jgi:hypothetical protein